MDESREGEHQKQTSYIDIFLVWGLGLIIYKKKKYQKQGWSWRGWCFSCSSLCLFNESHFFHLKLYLFVFKFSTWSKEWARNHLVARNWHPHKLYKLASLLKRLGNLKEIKRWQYTGFSVNPKVMRQSHPISAYLCMAALFLTCLLGKALEIWLFHKCGYHWPEPQL